MPGGPPASREREPLVIGGEDAAPRSLHMPPAAARALLLLIAMLYGSYDLTTKVLFSLKPTAPTPASACVVKSSLSLLSFGPVLLLSPPGPADKTSATSTTNDPPPPLWPTAVSLATWFVVAGALFFGGFARTTVSRGAFLLQLSVVATPVLEVLALRRRQPRVVWLAAATALLGVLFLAGGQSSQRQGDDTLSAPPAGGDASASSSDSASLLGDAMVASGAIAWAWYLVGTAALPPSVDAARLQAAKYVVAVLLYVGIAAALWGVGGSSSESPLSGWATREAWALAVYGAVIPGALADVLQQRAQAAVRASEASLLLASEPVWATLLAVPLLGETLGWSEFLGGGLILAAAAMASGVVPPVTTDDLPANSSAAAAEHGGGGRQQQQPQTTAAQGSSFDGCVPFGVATKAVVDDEEAAVRPGGPLELDDAPRAGASVGLR